MAVSRALLLQKWINVGFVGICIRLDENVVARLQGIVDCCGP